MGCSQREETTQTCRSFWLPLSCWQLLPSPMLRTSLRDVVSSVAASAALTAMFPMRMRVSLVTAAPLREPSAAVLTRDAASWTSAPAEVAVRLMSTRARSISAQEMLASTAAAEMTLLRRSRQTNTDGYIMESLFSTSVCWVGSPHCYIK